MIVKRIPAELRWLIGSKDGCVTKVLQQRFVIQEYDKGVPGPLRGDEWIDVPEVKEERIVSHKEKHK